MQLESRNFALWSRMAGEALIRPSAWVVPYAIGVAVKKKKKKILKKKKKKY